jgi:hypothetical protein
MPVAASSVARESEFASRGEYSLAFIVIETGRTSDFHAVEDLLP